jgi:dTDP-4-dehydrorhamnose 3,5-epimerase
MFHDPRGFFLETYNKMELQEIGIYETFIQDNQSSSVKGVLRGLHYQREHPQVKLIRVLCGEIFDVVVDMRKGSPTYGHHQGIFLSAENQEMLFVPIGFAHGFLALNDNTEVMYKVTDYFYPQYDAGIVWNDTCLKISWPFEKYGIDTPIVSEKDSRLPSLPEIDSPFEYQNKG